MPVSRIGGKLQISSKSRVYQAKKEPVINGLEKEEVHTFLPLLISLAYIFTWFFLKILTLNFQSIIACDVAYWLVCWFRSEGNIHLSKRRPEIY